MSKIIIMEEEVGIVIKVPKEFDLKLRMYILNMERKGIKKTKSETLLKLAIIGFNTEVKEI